MEAKDLTFTAEELLDKIEELARVYIDEAKSIEQAVKDDKPEDAAVWTGRAESLSRVSRELMNLSMVARHPDKFSKDSADIGLGLTDPIKIGDKFVWEPNNLKARELITVTDIYINGDNETWIESENAKGQRYWNEESRFREACVRATQSSKK